MAFFKKTTIWVIAYLLIFQVLLILFVPTAVVYEDRIKYDIVKNNIYNIEAVVKEIKDTIREKKLLRYAVILGDSVGYSTPCPSEASIGYYLNEISKREGSDIYFFNLSMPSMMGGDIYTMVKLLHKYGISTDNLIINLIYPGFIKGEPYNSSIFWMKDFLKDVDFQVFKEVYYGFYPVRNSDLQEAKAAIKHKINTSVPIFMYKDYLFNKSYLEALDRKAAHFFGQPLTEIASEPIRPWYEKDFLYDLMKHEDNSYIYTDKPFIMTDKNPQIYFLNKIIELQKGKNTVFFLAAMNDELLADEVNKIGYKENMQRINDFFEDKSVKFINYNGRIDYNLFSDFIHLIEDGYKYLAEDLWTRIIQYEGVGGK